MKIDVTNIITGDFETYWDKDYTLSKLPISEYVLDERFKAHCLGLKIGLEPAQIYWEEEIDAILQWIDWSTYTFLAHNAAFDAFILSQRYDVHPARILDTLSLARAKVGNARSNSLAELAEKRGLGGKDRKIIIATKGIRTIPLEQREAFGGYCINDTDLCLDLFLDLIQKFPAREFSLIDMTQKMFTEPILCVDLARANDQLIAEKGKKVRAILRTGVTAEQLMSDQQFANLLQREGMTNVPTKISPTTGKRTWAFAKTDEGMRSLLKSPSARIKGIAEARITLKSTIGQTRAQRLIQAGLDGRRLPVLLNYCGAHTTRWSAGNKMNLQNLPRGSEIRKSITAPPGYKLVICDSSQIEARLNAWFADQEDVLAQFQAWDDGTGPDVYKLMAAQIFNKPVEIISTIERFVGKVCVLALGYGMGADRMRDNLLEGGVDVALDVCQVIVQKYRDICDLISSMWKKANGIMYSMANGTEGEYKCIKWYYEKILLPNGLFLYYPELRIPYSTSEGSYQSREGRVKLYGPLLIENIIQALARVFIADAMLVVGEKYRIVTMSHDEIMCCVPEDQAEACYDLLSRTMKTSPVWAPKIPLNVEGGISDCYDK